MDQDVIDNYPVTPAKKTLPKWFKDLPQEKFSFPIGNTLPTIKKYNPNDVTYQFGNEKTTSGSCSSHCHISSNNSAIHSE